MFYRFNTKSPNNVARIQPMVSYTGLEMLTEDSVLINNNNFVIVKGKILYDLIPYNNSRFFAISDRLKNILEENDIKGIRFFPIRIESIYQLYFGIILTSKTGPILNREAFLKREEENIKFDINTWDGCDIFTIEDTLLFVCTDKVYNLIKRHKITNVKIEPL